MNTRYKFRAYMADMNEMIYDIQDMCNFKDWLQQADIDAVMQCTGLKDKNGELIYEGDIVSILYISKTQGRCYKDVVIWNNERCRFEGEKYGIWGTDDSLEVLGNIYENPELLEGKNE